MSAAEAVLRWWLAFSLVSLAFAPVTWWMAAGLGKYRYALTRPIGLVVATFLVWWPASLVNVPFRTETLIVGIIAGGIAGWLLLVRSGRSLLGDHRTLLVFEFVWVGAFLGYVAFRAANPDIANTEKPMEIALLSSIARSSEVPAPDPWYAGSPINYYYFGYQSVATLVHLSGVQVSTAFNLMLGSLFASTVTVASGLGAWLAERCQLDRIPVVLAGALAAFFVGLAGNLETFARLLTAPRETIDAGWWDGIGWQASRVIVDTGVNGNAGPSETINEFPAFSFVLGDLHPHLTTLPVLLTTIALAASLAGSRHITGIARGAAIGAFAGLLYASNSWDAPVGVVAVFGGVLMAHRHIDRDVVVRLATIAVAAAVAALPFALSYTAPVGVRSTDLPGWLTRVPVLGSLPDTIAIVTWRPSSTSELLTVHGIWILIASGFGAWVYSTSRDLPLLAERRLTALLPVVLIVCAGAIAWSPALVLLGLPGLTMLAIAILDDRMALRLIAALFGAGFGLALIPEFFYIQDSFGSRMNTVFKLNFQAWVFFGIASAVGALVVASRARGVLKSAAALTMTGLVLAASPYPILSAGDWMDLGVASNTLDGAAYLEVTNPAEASAIAWLKRNASEGDVVVEAPGCAYQTLNGVPMNRFSAFTGTSTLMGWANHERQWRRGEFANLSAAIGEREALAESWLDGQPIATPPEIEPRFVIFGTVERSTSDQCQTLTARGEAEISALQSQGWTVAFQEGQTTILAQQNDAVLGNGN